MKIAVVVLALVVACSMVEARSIEKRQDDFLGFFKGAIDRAQALYEQAENWWKTEGIAFVKAKVTGAAANLSNVKLGEIVRKVRTFLNIASGRLNIVEIVQQIKDALPNETQNLDENDLEDIVQAVSDVEDNGDDDNEVEKRQDGFLGFFKGAIDRAQALYEQAENWWKTEGIAFVKAKITGAAANLSNAKLGEIVGKARTALKVASGRLNIVEIAQLIKDALPQETQNLDENDLEDIVQAVSDVEDNDDDDDNEVEKRQDGFLGFFKGAIDRAQALYEQAENWWKTEGLAIVKAKITGAAANLSNVKLGEIVGKARTALKFASGRLNIEEIVQLIKHAFPNETQNLDENDLEDIVQAVSDVEDDNVDDDDEVEKRIFGNVVGWAKDRLAEATDKAKAWWAAEGSAIVKAKIAGAAAKLSDGKLEEIVGKARDALSTGRLNLEEIARQIKDALPHETQSLDENDLEDIVIAVSDVKENN